MHHHCTCSACVQQAAFRPEPTDTALAIGQALHANKGACRRDLFTLPCPVGRPVLECSQKKFRVALQHVVPRLSEPPRRGKKLKQP